MLVRFAIGKKTIITSIARIINRRLVIIIDGPCYSIISNRERSELWESLNCPACWHLCGRGYLFIMLYKQTQKKESIDQKAFNGRRSADKHRQLS